MISSDSRPELQQGQKTEVGNRFVRGAAFIFAAKIGERLLGLVSTLVLARLLLPEDFGLVAMAAPVIAFVELLGAIGLDSALIQRPNLEREHLDTAFTIGLLISIVIALVLVILAPIAAVYFREPRLEAVIVWLALGNLIQGFGNPGVILFRKEINMIPEVMFLLVKKITSLIVAAAAAMIIGNYWALVWGVLASRIVGVGLSYWITPFRPRLSLSKRHDVVGFSLWMLVVQILYFLHLRVNDLIIGRLLGPIQLAYFNLASDLASSATGEAVIAISRAAFPALSILSDDPQRLRLGFRQILAGVALIAIPAGLGIAATGELLVRVLLGERWLPVADVLGTLAVCSAILGIMSQVSYVYMALNKPRTAAVVSALSVITLIAASIAVIPTQGIGGLNLVIPAVTATVMIGHFFMLRKLLSVFLIGDWIHALWRPIISAIAMFVIVSLSTPFILAPQLGLPLFASMISLIVLGMVTYMISAALLWVCSGQPAGPEALLWGKLRKLRFNRP